MRLFFAASISCILLVSNAQHWQITKHPNLHRYAISTDTFTSDYLYSEVSELCEGKAYVAKGELYAYVNKDLKELTPYVFVEAHNFIDGYAIVGDSISKNLLNSRMQVILPIGVAQLRLPTDGLIIVKSHLETWGIYDVRGNQKLPMIYDIPPVVINRETIIVRKEEVYGVVNDCNEKIHPVGFQYISKNGLGYKQGKYLRLFNRK